LTRGSQQLLDRHSGPLRTIATGRASIEPFVNGGQHCLFPEH
jgi:hypothetical protein